MLVSNPIKAVWVPPTKTRFVTWKEKMYLLGRTTVPSAPADTAPEGKDEAGRNMPSTELAGEGVGEAEGWYIDGRPVKPGFPAAYDGTSVDGTSVGKAVGALIFILCVEELLDWAVGWTVG